MICLQISRKSESDDIRPRRRKESVIKVRGEVQTLMDSSPSERSSLEKTGLTVGIWSGVVSNVKSIYIKAR